MPKAKDMTPVQREVAYLLRALRLQMGMTMPNFGRVIHMDSNALNQREHFRTPWKESEINSLLTLLRLFATRQIENLEATAQKISPQPTTKTKQ